MTALPRLYPLAQSGVSETEYRSDALRITERHGLRLLRVRSLAGPSAPERVHPDWPQRTGETLGGALTVLCLRPGEWLCFGEAGADTDSLTLSLDPSNAAVYDQSDGLAVFRLEGPAAPWLLSKFSSLDFPGGARHGAHCARTRMGDASATLHYDGTGFDLFVDRSLARHFWERMIESARHAEYLGAGSLASQARGAA